MVDLHKEKRLRGTWWVFIVKYRTNGIIRIYKVRLVANEYTQIYGIEYQKTFALVAKMNTAQVLLSLAANYN